VAKTVGSGMIDLSAVTTSVILAGLIGAIVWDLITWFYGLPTSSSHALVGGYAGAAIAKAGVGALVPAGWTKTLVFILLAPGIGFVLGFAFMVAILWICRGAAPSRVDRWFRRLQLVSAALYSLGHGANDAQKTMGIIALALVGGEKAGLLKDLPDWSSFLAHPMVADAGGKEAIASWIKVTCALVMAAGTAAGGWKIIKTMGHKMVKLQPVHGFAAETTAATVLSTAGHFGMPVSTTHAITTSIMGVGCAKRFSALNLSVVERILWAWVLTLPVTALLAYGILRLIR